MDKIPMKWMIMNKHELKKTLMEILSTWVGLMCAILGMILYTLALLATVIGFYLVIFSFFDKDLPLWIGIFIFVISVMITAIFHNVYDKIKNYYGHLS